MNQAKISRLIALDLDWRRNPKFKELCRQEWPPQFFAYCEKKIAALRAIAEVEQRQLNGDPVELWDVSEISVEGW